MRILVIEDAADAREYLARRSHIAGSEQAQLSQVLALIYGWFTEGFDTQDLKDAKALLDELA